MASSRVLRCPTCFLRSQDVPQHESSIENCISERSVLSILPQTNCTSRRSDSVISLYGNKWFRGISVYGERWDIRIHLDLLNVLRPPFWILTTHSWLNWVDEMMMRMRLAWKKSHKTLDTSKRLHQNKTRSTGSAGKGLHSKHCHYWELRTRESAASPNHLN